MPPIFPRNEDKKPAAVFLYGYSFADFAPVGNETPPAKIV